MLHTPEIASIILIFVIILASYLVINRRRRNKKIRKYIKALWGKMPDRQYEKSELDSIASYYNNLKARENKPGVDDITWNDLDMDSIYKRINSTLTTIGDEYLYSLLRYPEVTDDILNERTVLINYFSENEKEREKLQFILAKLGRKRFVSVSDYFLDDAAGPSLKGRYYKLLSIAFILSPLSLLLNPALGIMVILGLLFTNITIYYRAKNELSSNLETLAYIVNMIGCGRKIAAQKLPGIKEPSKKLSEAIGKIKGVSINSFYSLFYRTEDPVLEYIKVVLLGELIAYESLLSIIKKHRGQLLDIYRIIGYLDSMVAAASYKISIPFSCLPQLEIKTGTGSAYIHALEIYHPLLKDPVTNSVDFSNSILLTGSNASGKSTFLKTLAINAIFAQSLNFCLASEYRSCYFRIYTSMALKDNIMSKESYFIAEIKSLKRIMDALSEDLPCLCLIDEVLRGTNTVERISASSEVLRTMADSNTLCIAATHDIELTYILEEVFENYHFRESFTDNEIVFDYKLYNGRSNTRNAIKLLKFMGYEESIVQRAQDRAAKYIETEKWI